MFFQDASIRCMQLFRLALIKKTLASFVSRLCVDLH